MGRYNFMHQMRRHCILKVPITCIAPSAVLCSHQMGSGGQCHKSFFISNDRAQLLDKTENAMDVMCAIEVMCTMSSVAVSCSPRTRQRT